jgi:hypothetical protein
MARRKPQGGKPAQPPGRHELRVEPVWLARVQRQADRLGISASAYIRLATSERLERDEATDPGLRKGGAE